MTHRPAGKLLSKLKTLLLLPLMLAAAALSAWAVYSVPSPIVDRMLEADLRKQADTWRRAVLLHLSNSKDAFVLGELDEHDREYLNLVPKTSDVYRLKLFESDGTIFWSTRAEEIGQRNTKEYFQTAVSQGVVYYKHEEKPATEVDGLMTAVNPDGSIPNREVAEVYSPVMHDGIFIGAIEFYSDITDVRNTFISRVRMSLALISLVTVTAMAIVSAVVFKSNRRSLRQVEERSAKDQEIMANQLQLAREVKLLGELNEWLQSCRSLGELFDMVSEFMSHLLPDSEGSIYVFSNSRDVLDGCASWNGGSHKDHIQPGECWGLRRGRTYEFGASEVEFTCAHAEPHDGRPYFCFPILAHGETVGLMHLRSRPSRAGDFSGCKQLAQMCAEQISMAIANVRMRDQLHDQSVRDPLTGLFNRRHMTECLRKFVGASQSRGRPLSVVSIDVDHFKKFNDNHGHDAGDMVLRAVGTALEQACDGEEVACRPGGEEFALLLPGVHPEDAVTKAELLRQAVEDVVVRYGEKALPRISISLGVAHYPAHGTMPQDLLRASDEALYEAKAKGRNQVCVAEGTAAAPRNPPAQIAAAGSAQDKDAAA
ncbi:sensor domain-containing diguanylate cyclase [Leisingera sp. McT4-56]|uniref:sensor domain-containing diguanylate cyclase n=1 Tax=Leisingera sp. McT4-56 TaxID=2881255 RepID=UPI001CF87B7B|nr:sensor domain-containing diguanylate cyclase [Leisingera sp. McT4-56]MCB4455903.1 sensor domain-containing diguanylate cyclase [Leisingera sp. McT4-56]